MAIQTVGDLQDELRKYSRATPLNVLVRKTLITGSETILQPMRVSTRRESGIDLICREVVEIPLPVDETGAVNQETWDWAALDEHAKALLEDLDDTQEEMPPAP